MNTWNTTRRKLLRLTAASIAVGSASLSGCVDPDAVLTMEMVDDQGIADNVSTNLSPTETSVLAEAVENGSATTIDVTVPYDGRRPVEHDGRYYDVETKEVGTGTVRRYTVAVQRADEDGNHSVMEFEDLPPLDQRKLRPMLRGSGMEDERVRGEVSYVEHEAEDSALVPREEFDAVRRDGQIVEIRDGGPREADAAEHRYTAETVAEGVEEFADWARERYLWTLTGLTEGERMIVEEAMDDGYYEGGVEDDFRSLAGRFVDRPAVEGGDWGGYYLVEYEGKTYWTNLHHPPNAV